MHNCSFRNFRYLRTPMGAVKVINVVFGVISLILVAVSYISVWTLAVFTGTVVACVVLSLLYLLLYLLGSPSVIQSKTNRVVSFLYHVLAGIALIVAGIELIGWSEYYDPSCKHDCPVLYTVGVAKTLTFMNGTLYLIAGFLGIKDDDLLDSESADAEIPLLSSTTVLASIPGSIAGSKQALHNGQNHHFYYYDNYLRQPKVPYDVRSSASSYKNQFIRPPPHYITGEYSLNESYNSAHIHNHHGAQNHHQHVGASASGNANNGRRTTKHLSSSVNVTSNSVTAT